jgi:GNAT superfamily N-acetyltransferase
MLTIRELTSNDDLGAAFPLMSQLRNRITAENFVPQLRLQQSTGYQLIGAFADGQLVALAGIRRSITLARGPHMFVDDLVSDERARGRGYGRTLLAWVEARAAGEGLMRVYLDSRETAKGFYERAGYTFLTAVPCWKRVLPERQP